MAKEQERRAREEEPVYQDPPLYKDKGVVLVTVLLVLVAAGLWALGATILGDNDTVASSRDRTVSTARTTTSAPATTTATTTPRTTPATTAPTSTSTVPPTQAPTTTEAPAPVVTTTQAPPPAAPTVQAYPSYTYCGSNGQNVLILVAPGQPRTLTMTDGVPPPSSNAFDSNYFFEYAGNPSIAVSFRADPVGVAWDCNAVDLTNWR